MQYCLECGAVTSDFVLVQDKGNTSATFLAVGQNLPSAHGNAPASSRVFSIQRQTPQLIRSVRELLGRLHITQARLADRCVDIIGSAQAKWQAEGTAAVVPQVLVGLAVYIACREEGHLLYMRDVYDCLEVPAKAFGACFRRVMEDLQLRLPPIGPRELLTRAVGCLLGNHPSQNAILEESLELVDWLQSSAGHTRLSSNPSMIAAMALALVSYANKGRVQCSVREIADQFRLSEQHTNNEVMRLRRVLLAEAQDVPWLRHLTGKTVAPHWRVITRLYNASHRSALGGAEALHLPVPLVPGSTEEPCQLESRTDSARIALAEAQPSQPPALPPSAAREALCGSEGGPDTNRSAAEFPTPVAEGCTQPGLMAEAPAATTVPPPTSDTASGGHLGAEQPPEPWDKGPPTAPQVSPEVESSVSAEMAREGLRRSGRLKRTDGPEGERFGLVAAPVVKRKAVSCALRL